MNDIKTITVFCGSSSGKNPVYEDSAVALGKIMAEKGITLVYGGGSRGLMGAVARGCFHNDGHVIGVIPKFLNDNPLVRTSKVESEIIVTEDMHERKQKMFEKGDAFIALPGGIGTFEEIFEQLAWLQLELHKKPCGFLNTNGFYDKLEQFLNTTEETGFVRDEVLDTIQWDSDPEKLINKLAEVEIKIGHKIS